jgi:hypothetical protein
MAADMISSAVVQETVSEILSNMKDEYKGRSNHKQHLERLEMRYGRNHPGSIRYWSELWG